MPLCLLKSISSLYGGPQGTLKDRSLLVRDGRIQDIGDSKALMDTLTDAERDDLEIRDCSGLLIIPGFVDSHTHLLFYGSREAELYLRAAGRPYLDILAAGGGIHSTVDAVRKASEEVLLQNGLDYLDRALELGITTVEIKSGYGLDFANEEKMLRVMGRMQEMHPVDIIPTFLVHSVPRGANRESFLSEVEKRMIPAFRTCAAWFDLFLEKGVFSIQEAERLLHAARTAGYRLGLHTNQVHDVGGIALADRMGVRHVDHLEVLSETDAEIIRANPDLYAVFLPAAEGYVFSGHVGQIHRLMDIPGRLVLSSDFNPGSSPVLSPLFVMTYAVLRYRIHDPAFLLNTLTANAADMLCLTDRGRIAPGALADLAALDLDSIDQIPYWGTMNRIRFVMKAGRIFDIHSRNAFRKEPAVEKP